MYEALPFKHIVAGDFEFEFDGHASSDDAKRSGECPRPICGVFRELRTGQTWRVWRDEFGPQPPFPCGPDTLFVAYYASAEIGCFLALGWKPPLRILDLFTEFRNLTNGCPTIGGAGLVGALMHFGLDTIGADSKDEMRMLALRGGPWTAAERVALTDYCAGDTLALERLLPAIMPHIACDIARPVHGGGGGNGVERHANRRGGVVRTARALGWHPRRSDSGDRRRLRCFRGP